MEDINKILKEKGLKVTPQRIAVLKALKSDRTHPSAEVLIKSILKDHPYISVGTIYNILDTFVNKGIVEKIHTDDNIMRYDPVIEDHHHLYLDKDGEILDYYDEELTELVKRYLENKKDLDFVEIEKIKINLIGRRVK